jgi:hypothetical protein
LIGNSKKLKMETNLTNCDPEAAQDPTPPKTD